ncbi:H/ACA ribonucleoprotein complex subunit 3-like [Meriones unguiculatus]|uniref:H/ACA ribonucleoprotein complex subunit 3-like n=1 Tax=Meriones unguiculatus TaxID=10047 RepID=UPI00293EFE2A|nr:H/ACA ribonucleoprotein complex subunit 3-like [Meriones unguiculatus]
MASGTRVTFLQCYLSEQGNRVYTLKKFDPMGQQTCSAHPARFSPDNKYSRHGITIKRRFKVLMTQQPRPDLSSEGSLTSCAAPSPPPQPIISNQTPQS